MIRTIALMTLMGVTILTPMPAVARVPLQRLNPQHKNITCCQSPSLGLDEQIWGENGQPGDWRAMLASIDNSLRYLKSPTAAKAYRRYSGSGITRDRAIRSLVRFRELVVSSPTPKHFKNLSAASLRCTSP
jgi:membrane-bound lytic murein transglycosylase A